MTLITTIVTVITTISIELNYIFVCFLPTHPPTYLAHALPIAAVYDLSVQVAPVHPVVVDDYDVADTSAC